MAKKCRRLGWGAMLAVFVVVLLVVGIFAGFLMMKAKNDAIMRYITYPAAKDAQLSAEGAIWWWEYWVREGEDTSNFLMRYDLARGELAEIPLTQEQSSQGRMLPSDVPGGVLVLAEYEPWPFGEDREQDFGRYQFFAPDDLTAGPLFEVELGPDSYIYGLYGDWLYYKRDGIARRSLASGEEQRYGDAEGYATAISPDGKLLLDNSGYDLYDKFPEREIWIGWANYSIATPGGGVEPLVFPEGQRERCITWESEESLIAILTNMDYEETLCRYSLAAKTWEPVLDSQGRSIDVTDLDEFVLSPDGKYMALCEPLSEYDRHSGFGSRNQNFIILSLQTGERYALHTLEQTNEIDYRHSYGALNWTP